MSTAGKPLADWLAKVPTATSLSSKRLLLLGNNGVLEKLNSVIFPYYDSSIIDADSTTEPGIYKLDYRSTGLPTAAGGNILVVLTSAAQIYVRIGNGGEIWFRINTSGWTEWKKVAFALGGVIYCPISLKGGVRHEYGRKKVFGNTIARRSLSTTWSVLGWLGGKSACVAVNDVQRKSLGLKRCLGSDRVVSPDHRLSELSIWSNAKPFGRDTVFERDRVWRSNVVRNEFAQRHLYAYKNGIFLQRLVLSDHDILAYGKEVAA